MGCPTEVVNRMRMMHQMAQRESPRKLMFLSMIPAPLRTALKMPV